MVHNIWSKPQSEEFQQNNLLKSCIGSLVKSENCYRTASPPDLAHYGGGEVLWDEEERSSLHDWQSYLKRVETQSSRAHRNLETVHLSIRGKIKNLVLSPNVADEITERKSFPSRTDWQPRKSWNETLALWILSRPDDSIELELRLCHSDVTDMSPSDENLDWHHAIVHGCETHEIDTWHSALDSANVLEFQRIM